MFTFQYYNDIFLPSDFKTPYRMILLVCYMDAYIEFLKGLVSRGDYGSERVKQNVIEQVPMGNLSQVKFGSRGKPAATESRYSALMQIGCTHTYEGKQTKFKIILDGSPP